MTGEGKMQLNGGERMNRQWIVKTRAGPYIPLEDDRRINLESGRRRNCIDGQEQKERQETI